MLDAENEEEYYMTTRDLLERLRQLHILFWVEGEKLRCKAPIGTLTTELQDQIRQHKDEIISLAKKKISADHTHEAEILPRDSAMDQIPLSFAQQRLWFSHQLEPESPVYNGIHAVTIRGPLNIDIQRRCLTEVIRRHESLRTTFSVAGGEPFQVIHPPYEVPLLHYDIRGLAREEQQKCITQITRAITLQPYDLEKGPLGRYALLQRGEQEYIFLLALHHIVSDGWSIGVLIRENIALYRAYQQGKSSPLPGLTVQYADFALWQRRWVQQVLLQPQLEYWRSQLVEIPLELQLPFDKVRPTQPTFVGSVVRHSLSAAQTAHLKAFSHAEGVTLFMTLLAAFQVLLACYTGQDDILVGTPIANRNRSEIEGLIGFFVNTLVMRINLSDNPTVEMILQRVREIALRAYANQDLPFEKLVESLHPERIINRHPIVQVSFDFHNAHRDPLIVPGFTFEVVDTEANHSIATDIAVEIDEDEDGGLITSYYYQCDLFERDTIAQMVERYAMILEEMILHPHQRLSQLSLVSAKERRQLLVEWNKTSENAASFSQDLSFPRLFEQQAAAAPEALAIAYMDEYITYRALNARANQLAHRLQHLGVFPGQIVALLLQRSPDFLIAVLALFKVGAAYLPLDPFSPARRFSQILSLDGISLVLTTSEFLPVLTSLSDSLPQTAGFQIELLERLSLETQPANNPGLPCYHQSLAYIIYTSGSTGTPKGAMVEHQGILNHIYAKIQDFSLSTGDCVAQTAALCFDISVWQFLAPLITGGYVQIIQDDELRTPLLLLATLQQYRISVLEVVPSLLRALLEELKWHGNRINTQLPSLRWLISTGEALPPDLCRQWLQYYPSIPLANVYGPTECSDDVTHYLMASPPLETDRVVPIGRPVITTQIYVLNKYMEPLPIGIPGELYVGGIQVGWGYFSHPDLTAVSFTPDPFGKRPGSRLYRTGDRARYRSDGRIEFLGRIDQQVKLRGYRIEPSEIEATLQALPGIRDAVVELRDGEGEQEQLVAYLIASTAEKYDQEREQWSPACVRAALQEQLPGYMVPSAYMFLERFPLTSSGKLDRRKLPKPEKVHLASSQIFLTPRTELERTLSDIWAEVLAVKQVGVQENFFELGGHSLLATRLISRLRQALQLELPVRTLFESPTISSLAQRIRLLQPHPSTPSLPALQPSTRRDQPLPLSFAQQRLWFLDQFDPARPVYNLPLAVRVQGPFQPSLWQACLHTLLQRHESLRTIFVSTDGHPAQRILPSLSLHIPIIDLQGLPSLAQHHALHHLLQQEADHPFDLSTGPLLRGAVIHYHSQDHVLLLTLHHIITDGWSLEILVRELRMLYHARRLHLPDPLPALPVQYADYALWQRSILQGQPLADLLQYWRRQLADLPSLVSLPSDHPRTSSQHVQGQTYHFSLSATLTQRLKHLSQTQGVTLFMTLLAAFQILLARWSGQEDVVVGTPIANRTQESIEHLIGLFVNTLALRTDVSGNPSFSQLLQQVREVCLQAYAHQDIPFEKLVEELQPQRDLSHPPLFQVAFALQNTPQPVLTADDLLFQVLSVPSTTSKFDLTLAWEEGEVGLSASIEYASDLFEEQTIARFAAQYHHVLEAVTAEPDSPINRISLLSPQEHDLLQQWNATSVPRSTTCLPEMFEAQVAQTPERIAVVAADHHLSYRGLARWADLLADALCRVGVGPEAYVGVFLSRSLEMLIGILAILKTGGAYVPLDPAYPSERIAFILEDAQVRVIVSQRTLQADLPTTNIPILWLDELLTQPANKAGLESSTIEGKQQTAHPDNIAYAIYTSGSTGLPKGVMVSHRQVVRLLEVTRPRFQFNSQDIWTFFHSFAFDFSVWELWGALFFGGRLVVVPYLTSRSPEAFYNLLDEQNVTILNQTPSGFSLLLQVAAASPQKKLAALRTIIFGGEALEPESLKPWIELYGYDHPQLVNMYGITETTVHATYHLLAQTDILQADKSPIGKPLADLQLYLLDRYQQLVPIGAPGEIYIGGEGLARGYLKHPELTAVRFIPHPFSATPGERLYKTGDLGRYRSDGTIEFLGRLDTQIKLRGFRIELGEIEALLRNHAAVQDAAVIVNEPTPGDQRLRAFVIPDSQTAFPARQWARLQHLGSLNGHKTYTLPNSMKIVHQNRAETDFGYQEIFTEQTYSKYGLVIPQEGCIFDVGANIGLFSLWITNQAPQAHIFAFEPVPQLFASLQINASLYSQCIHALPYGLGEQASQETFTYYPGISIISGRYGNSKEERAIVQSYLDLQGENKDTPASVMDELLELSLQNEQISCEIRPLSHVLREYAIEQVDLLKIDVEKSEWDVLCGIEEDDWARIKQVVIEVHASDGRLERIQALLQRHGFVLGIEQEPQLVGTELYTVYARRTDIQEEPPQKNRPASWISPDGLIEDLRVFLVSKLPLYMLPSTFTLLDTFPLTPNGKLDRKRLSAWERSSLSPSQASDSDAPRTTLEHSLVDIWQSVLGLQHVGIQQNFFALGGHSLLATRLISRLRQTFQIELPLRSIFEAPTISGLALLIEEGLNKQKKGQAVPISHITQAKTAQLLERIDHLSDEEVDVLLKNMLLGKGKNE